MPYQTQLCCNVRNTSEHQRLHHQTEASVQYLGEADPTTVFREPTTQKFHCRQCHTGYDDPRMFQARPTLSFLPSLTFFQGHTQSCLAIEDVSEGQVECGDPCDLPDLQTFSLQRSVTPDLPIPDDMGVLTGLAIDQLPQSRLGPQLASQMQGTPQKHTWIQDIYQLDANDNDKPDHEAFLLRPGPDTVVRHSDIPLERLGLVINTVFGRIICLACQRQVFAQYLFQHLWIHFGRYISVPGNIVPLIYQHFNIQTSEAPIYPRGTEAIPAIFGLRIHPDFYFCGSCGRGYCQDASLHHHITSTQGCCPPKGVQAKVYRGYAQTFMTGPLRRFFRVRLHKLQSGGMNDFQTLVAGRLRLRPQDIPISALGNFRDLTQLLASEGWYDHVQPFNPAELCQLVSVPLSSAEPVLAALRPHVLAYLRMAQRLILKCRSSGLLQMLGDIGGGHILESFETVGSATLSTHALHLERLLCFVMRSWRGWASTYTCPLNLYQRGSCECLWRALMSNPSNTSTLALVHSVMYNLFSQEVVEWRDDIFFSPVTRALALVSLRQDGGWHPASIIADIVASMMYCVRSTMIYHLYVLSKTERKHVEEVVDKVRPLLIHGRETAMSYLIDVYKYLVVLRRNDQGQSLTKFTDQHGQTLLYQGNVVRLADIRTMVMALADRYRNLLEQEIFQGLSNHSSLHLVFNVSSLVDDLGNRDAFYSFIDNPQNTFFQKRDNFLKLLLTHQRLAGRYHFLDNDQVVWHAAASLNLLKTIQRARSLLLVITHLTYGSPGLGADILMHTTANVPGSLARSVVILGKRLCFVGAHSKAASHGSATEVTPRALPDFLADLWIQHLVLIRPVEVEIARALFGDEAAIRCRLYLCPTLSHELPPEDFSGVLGDLTHEHLGTRLTVQPWRQAQACFAKRHGLSSQREMGLDDEQRSNTGLTHDMLKGLDKTRMHDCLRASQRWHAVVGVGREDGPPAVGDALGTSDVVSPSAADRRTVATDLQVVAAELQTVAAAMGDRLELRLHTMLDDIMVRLGQPQQRTNKPGMVSAGKRNGGLLM